MTRNDALVSKNDQLPERARVLGLLTELEWLLDGNANCGPRTLRFLEDAQCFFVALTPPAPADLSIVTNLPSDRLQEIPDIAAAMLSAVDGSFGGSQTLWMDGPEARWAAERLGLPPERVTRVSVDIVPDASGVSQAAK